MLEKKIKYTDYNGEEREETFYFHLSQAELADLELTATGGFETMINRIIETKDNKKLVAIFKEMIDLSVGIKSLDGRNFSKTKEILDDFKSTEAYTVLYMELLSSEEAALEFVKGILPKQIQNKAQT